MKLFFKSLFCFNYQTGDHLQTHKIPNWSDTWKSNFGQKSDFRYIFKLSREANWRRLFFMYGQNCATFFFHKKKMSPTDGFWLSLTWSQHLHIFLDFYSDSQLYTKSYTLAAFIAVCGAKRLDLQGLYINTYYILQQTGELCH